MDIKELMRQKEDIMQLDEKMRVPLRLLWNTYVFLYSVLPRFP